MNKDDIELIMKSKADADNRRRRNYFVKIHKEYELHFDFEKEIKRIKKIGEEPLVSELIKMVDAFIDGEYPKCFEIYENLPESKEMECAGQEYVGPWFSAFNEIIGFENSIISCLDYEHTAKWAKPFANLKAKIQVKIGHNKMKILNTIDENN